MKQKWKNFHSDDFTKFYENAERNIKIIYRSEILCSLFSQINLVY